MSGYLKEKASSSVTELSTSKPSPHEQAHARPSVPANYQEYVSAMNDNIAKEYFINDRKRRYNKESGRKAVVNEIMTGKAPESKVYLFPFKATHTQILAMTGTLKSPDANIIPPEVPRGRRWLGENLGFEN
jgi:hypothetical protein